MVKGASNFGGLTACLAPFPNKAANRARSRVMAHRGVFVAVFACSLFEHLVKNQIL